VTHCVHCGIRFLTHPRNAGRVDLRCPFGCRKHHRKQRSSQRSTAYYETPEGKQKKKRLNARRRSRSRPAECEPHSDPVEQTDVPDEQLPEDLQVKLELRLEGVVLDESTLVNSPMLPYVQMVVGLIEDVHLNANEIVCMLGRAMRQHSIAYRSKTDYVLCFLHQRPP